MVFDGRHRSHIHFVIKHGYMLQSNQDIIVFNRFRVYSKGNIFLGTRPLWLPVSILLAPWRLSPHTLGDTRQTADDRRPV